MNDILLVPDDIGMSRYRVHRQAFRVFYGYGLLDSGVTMKNFFGKRVALLAILAAALTMQASAFGIQELIGGKSSAEKVQSFTRIDFGLPGDLVIIQGNEHSITIEADRDTKKRIKTSIKGGELRIWIESNIFNWFVTDDIKVTVTLPEIAGVILSGSGNISAPQGIDADSLSLTLSGSGNIKMDVTADSLKLTLSGSGNIVSDIKASQLKATLSGSGNIRLDGNSDAAVFTISGSGNIRADECKVQDAEATIAGSGEMLLRAEETLNIRIVGSGSVRYSGRAKVTSEIVGSGDIREM